MNTPNYYFTPLSRQERRKQFFNKVVDILQHMLVMFAFILFLSFLQMLINK